MHKNTKRTKRIFIPLLIICLFLGWTNSSFAQITNEDLPKSGMNVTWSDFAYFTTALPFTNAIKHSSGFTYGEFDLDQNGYPTSIPEGEEAVNYIFLETTHYPTGDYTLTWEGEGAIRVSTCSGLTELDESSEKRQTISVTNACEGGISLTITATNPEDYIRNINFYLPGHNENSSIWMDHYVDYFAEFELVRFAWAAGMYASITSWDERVTEQRLTYLAGDTAAIGLPYEAMIELANRANVDLWVILPARANDDFERQMATLIRDNLNDELRYWMEWGNEQWNCGYWGYEACDYLYETIEGTDLAPPDQYAIETVRSAEIFIEVFNETGERSRLITVLGGQSDNGWQLETAAQRMTTLNRMDIIDVIAIGAYFMPDESFNPITPVLDDGMPAIMDAVLQCSDNFYDPTSEMGAEFRKNIAVAQQHNKPFVAYEGGQHLTDWIGVDEEVLAEINRNPAMYDVYVSHLLNWDSLNSGTFVHYASYGDYDRGEAFGLKEYYDQPLSENHKLRAALDHRHSRLPDLSRILSSVQAADFDMYPNPASEQLNIALSSGAQPQRVRIFSMQGALVINESLADGRSLDIGHLDPGLYLVEVAGVNQSLKKKLLIR